MELGTENRKKVIIASVLIVVAVIALARLLFTGSAPAAASPPTRVATPVVAPGKSLQPVAKRSTRLEPSLDPTLRFDWLKASEDVKYEGRGRNIFRAEAESVAIPQPVAPPVTDQPAQQAVNVPPPPPPIRLKFYGFANARGSAKKVFLSDEGGDIFVAGEGDIVDRQYRILRISPMSVEVEDVLNNNRQQIPLTQG